MLILVLAQERHSYTTKRLVEAGKRARHHVVVRSPHRFRLGFTNAVSSIDGASDAPADLVISRFGMSVQTYGVAVLGQLELMGVPPLNSSGSIELVRNRVRCTQALIANQVDVPRSVLVRRGADVKDAIAAVGGLPVMLRRVTGRPTLGLLFCETEQGCVAALEALWGLGHEVLLSEQYSETHGEGIRCLVVGGEVVAAIRRKGRTVRTRFLFERRGKATELRPSKKLKALMTRVAEATGLMLAGVDVLETSQGYKVMEVNAVPGLEQLERATGRDLARLVIEAGVSHARSLRPVEPPKGKRAEERQ